MSTTKNKRGSVASSLATISRGEHTSDGAYRPGSSRPRSSKARRGDPVWGQTPKWKGGQSGFTELLEMQVRLNKRICAQAKLSKTAKSEVRSTEVERLRVVNQALLDLAPKVKGVKNPFLERNLNDAQMKSEDMLRRHGCTKLVSRNPASSGPSPRRVPSRRKFAPVTAEVQEIHTPRDWFSLKGPFARYYRRQVERGYLGSPESWIRGPRAAKLRASLTEKGFALPPLTEFDCFNPNSPLHWALNKCSVQQQLTTSRGFLGERLNVNSSNLLVRRRQASSTQRLKISDWPRDSLGRSWPTYPTLSESWMMARLGKHPIHHGIDPVQKGFLSEHRRPLRQVKPGTAARVISNLVIGIRADIEIPRKFLAYFRYRWGFLILKRSHRKVLPPKLVRLISTIWKEDFSGMFLKCPIRFNEALRRVPHKKFYSLWGFVPATPTRRLDKTPRRRRGRNERLRQNRGSRSPDLSLIEGGSSSSDKSDDGVRLC